MPILNLYATARGDFATASVLTVDEAVAVADELSLGEIVYDLSAEARRAVLEALEMRMHTTPQGDVVIVWGIAEAPAAQKGAA